MRCKNCGREMPEGTVFCGNCGWRMQEEKTFCPECGAEIAAGADFCSNCGRTLNIREVPQSTVTRKQNNKSMTVILILLAILIALMSIIVGYILYSANKKGTLSESMRTTPVPAIQATDTPAPSITQEPTPTPTMQVTPPPVQNYVQNSGRTDLYSSSLTYKRMPEIHSSIPTSDSVFYELESVIEVFDSQCESYINGISDYPPSYLKAGTTAYEQQVSYKKNHPNLMQTYQQINVINARQGSGYYYVWVSETLNMSENGKSRTSTDHWVYKIENQNGQWYIVDYTKDPAY